MERCLRIYKCGSTYKYITTNLTQKNYVNDVDNKKQEYNNNEKLLNNIIRAKTKIKDLCLCNKFKYFITLTFNSNFNRHDLNTIRQKVNNRIRKFRKLTNKPFKFIFIPEQHKEGAWHLHGLIDNSIDDYIYENANKYDSISIFDFFGFNSISKIKDKDAVANYVTKYISKDFAKRVKGEHLYFCSQKLNRPVLLKEKIYNNEWFNHYFFDYRNDWCMIKYSNLYNYCDIILK